MSELPKRLTDLWELPEAEREKGVKLLSKIFNNILSNPNDPKFRDLNFSKIRKKLDTCKPAFYLLFCAGFGQSVDGSRLQWEYNTVTMKLLQEANAGLLAKISGQDVGPSDDYGGVIDPTETETITDRNMMVHRKKKEKKKLEKLQKQAEEQQLAKDMQQIEQMETEQNENTADNAQATNPDADANANANAADGDVDDEEMRKAMAMSMEQDGDNNAEQKPEDGGDVAMAGNEDGDGDGGEQSVASQLQDAGLSQEDLALIEQIKAAKGITATLKPSDLVGLSKEEKVAKFREIRDKYRKEQKQHEVMVKLEKERKRREGVKKAQEAERKRKEYEMRMLAGRKKREKAEAERRKKMVKEKIAADKKRRQEQKEREQRKKEAEKLAKQQQEQENTQ